jgi:predicted nucleotidyltransferase
MRRDEALRIIAQHAAELREQHAVKTLSIFGSVARDEAREDSDVDVLVEFSKPVGLFKFSRLQIYLEQLLGSKVDLATESALRDFMRPQILKEAIRAA